MRKNNTKSDRAAQLGLRPVPKDENQIEGVDIKEKACRMSGSVKGVEEGLYLSGVFLLLLYSMLRC